MLFSVRRASANDKDPFDIGHFSSLWRYLSDNKCVNVDV